MHMQNSAGRGFVHSIGNDFDNRLRWPYLERCRNPRVADFCIVSHKTVFVHKNFRNCAYSVQISQKFFCFAFQYIPNQPNNLRGIPFSKWQTTLRTRQGSFLTKCATYVCKWSSQCECRKRPPNQHVSPAMIKREKSTNFVIPSG